MDPHRNGEKGDIPIRNQRYFQKDNYWYYITREGVDIGPFDTLPEAEVGAREFIEYICNAERSMIETLEQYGRAVA
mgnify:CR=1 FL=1